MVFLGILLEDFQTAYEQVSRGEAIHLPPKTPCSSGRNAYRSAAELQQEQDYWLAERENRSRLPVDYSGREHGGWRTPYQSHLIRKKPKLTASSEGL